VCYLVLVVFITSSLVPMEGKINSSLFFLMEIAVDVRGEQKTTVLALRQLLCIVSYPYITTSEMVPSYAPDIVSVLKHVAPAPERKRTSNGQRWSLDCCS
jgi:hypothetical protein